MTNQWDEIGWLWESAIRIWGPSRVGHKCWGPSWQEGWGWNIPVLDNLGGHIWLNIPYQYLRILFSCKWPISDQFSPILRFLNPGPTLHHQAVHGIDGHGHAARKFNNWICVSLTVQCPASFMVDHHFSSFFVMRLPLSDGDFRVSRTVSPVSWPWSWGGPASISSRTEHPPLRRRRHKRHWQVRLCRARCQTQGGPANCA